jgi:hypothetical protein
MRDLEPIIKLLAGLLVFSIVVAFAAEVFFPSDGAFFQLVSNLVSGILGALLMRTKPRDSTEPTKSTTFTTTVEETKPPQDPAK